MKANGIALLALAIGGLGCSTDHDSTIPAGGGSGGAPGRPSNSAGAGPDAAAPLDASSPLADAATALDAGATDAGALDAGQGDAAAPPAVLAADVLSLAQAFMAEAHIPGLSLATVSRTGVTWSMGLGYADAAGTVPVTANTSFWLASVTKPITGLALLKAQERGELTLDTSIAELLQTASAFTLGYDEAAAITLRHLVTHRSAIRDTEAYACSYFIGTESSHTSLANEVLGSSDCNDSLAADLGGFLREYLSADGAYYSSDNFAPESPGSTFAYSNVGAALAGYALQLATGRSLADYAEEQFFGPLGLANTSFYASDLNPATIAEPTSWDEEAGELVALPRYELSTWPDGGLRSSASDLGKLIAALSGGGQLGDVRILEPATVEQATTAIASVDGDNEIGVFWLLGSTSAVEPGGAPRLLAEHDGGDPGASSYVVFDPAGGPGIVVLGNGLYDPEDEGIAAALSALTRTLFRYAQQLDTAVPAASP
jgi:CubicO group peptidase (beta-lactamase class C family)